MPVTPTSYEALTLDAVVGLVAGSTTFRTAAGAADAAAARGLILLVDGGILGEDGNEELTADSGATFDPRTVPAWAHVGAVPPELQTSAAVPYLWQETGSTTIRIWAKPATAYNPPDFVRWAMNLIGGIRADIIAQIGGATTLLAADITARLEALPKPGDHATGYAAMSLDIDWRSLP
jgi:hypothetical protein